jgi:hypothetical protein
MGAQLPYGKEIRMTPLPQAAIEAAIAAYVQSRKECGLEIIVVPRAMEAALTAALPHLQAWRDVKSKPREGDKVFLWKRTTYTDGHEPREGLISEARWGANGWEQVDHNPDCEEWYPVETKWKNGEEIVIAWHPWPAPPEVQP